MWWGCKNLVLRAKRARKVWSHAHLMKTTPILIALVARLHHSWSRVWFHNLFRTNQWCYHALCSGVGSAAAGAAMATPLFCLQEHTYFNDILAKTKKDQYCRQRCRSSLRARSVGETTPIYGRYCARCACVTTPTIHLTYPWPIYPHQNCFLHLCVVCAWYVIKCT
jgi:hypothetical protein